MTGIGRSHQIQTCTDILSCHFWRQSWDMGTSNYLYAQKLLGWWVRPRVSPERLQFLKKALWDHNIKLISLFRMYRRISS